MWSDRKTVLLTSNFAMKASISARSPSGSDRGVNSGKVSRNRASPAVRCLSHFALIPLASHRCLQNRVHLDNARTNFKSFRQSGSDRGEDSGNVSLNRASPVARCPLRASIAEPSTNQLVGTLDAPATLAACLRGPALRGGGGGQRLLGQAHRGGRWSSFLENKFHPGRHLIKILGGSPHARKGLRICVTIISMLQV